MLAQRLRMLTYILVFSSFIALFILAMMEFWFDKSCKYGEKRVCNFRQNLKNDDLQQLHGLYTNSEKQLKIQYVFSNENKEINIKASNANPIHAIETDEFLYVYDSIEMQWYQQRKFYATKYDNDVATNFYEYLTEQKKYLLSPDLKFVFIDEMPCRDTYCYRYKITDSKTPSTLTLIISDEEQLEGLIIERLGGDVLKFDIIREEKEIKIPEKFTMVPNEENLLLEVRTRTIDQKKPDYIKRFIDEQKNQ